MYGCLEVIQGHGKVTIQYIIYKFILGFILNISLFCVISEARRDIGRKSYHTNYSVT